MAPIPKIVYKISYFTTAVCGTYLLRDSFRGAEFKNDIRCDKKVAVVTGGSSGIGKATAKELARRGAVVYLLCRDKYRCANARKEIVLQTKNRYVYARECDLGSLNSVKNFVQEFKKVENKVDILINNAGVWRIPKEKTKDGFEVHLGVNHMGHFFLTNLLLNLLKEAAPSRIVNVSAASHAQGKINKEDLNSEVNYSEKEAYNQSKLANILFTKELAERLKGTGVTANAVDPGISSTELYRLPESSISSTIGKIFLAPFKWIFHKSALGGAQTVLYAALDPDLEKVSGKYFVDCKEEEVAPQAQDNYTAKWLWAVSEKWTKLKETSTEESGYVVFN